MIVVRTSVGRLMEHVRGTPDGFGVPLVRACPGQQPRLDAGRTKYPLERPLVVEQKSAHKGPIARLIKKLQRGSGLARVTCNAESIVGKEPSAIDRAAFFVGGVVNDVGVAAVSMTVMPRMATTPWGRQIADANGSRQRELASDATRGVFDRADQTCDAESRVFARPRAHKAFAFVGQRHAARVNETRGRGSKGRDKLRWHGWPHATAHNQKAPNDPTDRPHLPQF